jgi:ribonuclease HI
VNVILCTDASCCPFTGVSAWGMWVSSERGVTTGSGDLPDYSGQDMAVAEATAARLALIRALSLGVICDGDLVSVYTDNNEVPRLFANKGTGPQAWRKAGKDWRATLRAFDLRYTWGHVRGHTEAREDAHAKFEGNREADRLAGAHMTVKRRAHPIHKEHIRSIINAKKKLDTK